MAVRWICCCADLSAKAGRGRLVDLADLAELGRRERALRMRLTVCCLAI